MFKVQPLEGKKKTCGVQVLTRDNVTLLTQISAFTQPRFNEHAQDLQPNSNKYNMSKMMACNLCTKNI